MASIKWGGVFVAVAVGWSLRKTPMQEALNRRAAESVLVRVSINKTLSRPAIEGVLGGVQLRRHAVINHPAPNADNTHPGHSGFRSTMSQNKPHKRMTAPTVTASRR